MRAEERKYFNIDPRTGLFLLLIANIIAFTQNEFEIECGLIVFLAVITLLCGCVLGAVRWTAVFGILLLLQWYVLPVSPKIIAASFSIFISYARRMLPCLMVGSLMLKTISLHQLIVGLRSLHVPQKLIIPISVTLRYFPAIREETGYIRDAMRLRRIRGLEKIEALIVPLMISATVTAEELAAAAVTRGIENPAKKTSMTVLRMSVFDWSVSALGIAFLALAFFG